MGSSAQAFLQKSETLTGEADESRYKRRRSVKVFQRNVTIATRSLTATYGTPDLPCVMVPGGKAGSWWQ